MNCSWTLSADTKLKLAFVGLFPTEKTLDFVRVSIRYELILTWANSFLGHLLNSDKGLVSCCRCVLRVSLTKGEFRISNRTAEVNMNAYQEK